VQRIVITGGCGFIGSNLIAQLKRAGNFEIVVFDNEVLGRHEWISEFGVKFVRGDITDRKAVRQVLEGMDGVVHLAADTRVIPSIEKPRFNFHVNVEGTLNILEEMRAGGVNRLINASTGGAIVGNAEPPVHELMPASPLSPYGASKLAVEGYCSAFAASYGMNIVSLRFSNVYGPRSYHKGSVVAHFLKQLLKNEPLIIYGDGSQTRDFVFVEDLCGGIMRALSMDVTGVYQLGSGEPTSVNELVDAMRAATGVPVPVRHEDFRAGEVLATYSDIARARKVLGFEPKTSLKDGLRHTWKWFVDNRQIFGA
jgi:UDP-glucose 4-epimerase